MKQVSWIVVSLVLFLSTALVEAQAVDKAAQRSAAKPHRTGTQMIDFALDLQEKMIIEVAELCPRRSTALRRRRASSGAFAEQLRHIAADNYLLGAGILQEKPPADTGVGESGSAAVRTKAEIIAYVKASFAYMHRAAAAIDDANQPIPTPEISPWPPGTATRLGVAMEDCIHTWDHYGQLVIYLRMNGIVPPASRR